MTDQLRQAAQQALEFLEGGSFVYPTQLATALREALAQPEQPEQEPLKQVRPAELSRIRKGKDTVAGAPVYWAEWLSKE